MLTKLSWSKLRGQKSGVSLKWVEMSLLNPNRKRAQRFNQLLPCHRTGNLHGPFPMKDHQERRQLSQHFRFQFSICDRSNTDSIFKLHYLCLNPQQLLYLISCEPVIIFANLWAYSSCFREPNSFIFTWYYLTCKGFAQSLNKALVAVVF